MQSVTSTFLITPLSVPASGRIAQAMWQYIAISFGVIVAVFCR